MSLSSEVQARMSSQRLIELTNDMDPTATTVDTTILGYACTDIEADFELLSSENFDDTNSVHLAIAIPAVMGKLYEYQGKVSPHANEAYDVFIAKCERLREGDLSGPTTNSFFNVKDSYETSSDYFYFDKLHFSKFRPRTTYNRDDSKETYW